jgi:hypothetical protein
MSGYMFDKDGLRKVFERARSNYLKAYLESSRKLSV